MYYTENDRLGITNLTNKLRELVCFGRVDNAYSTSGTRHVAGTIKVLNPHFLLKCLYQEEFEDIKGVIRIGTSKDI
jgi:hypothetical protein